MARFFRSYPGKHVRYGGQFASAQQLTLSLSTTAATAGGLSSTTGKQLRATAVNTLGAVARQAGTTVSTIINTIEAMSSQPAKLLTASVATAGKLGRALVRALLVTAVSAGSLSVRLARAAMTATVVTTRSLVTIVGKSLTTTANSTGKLLRTLSTAQTAQLTTTGRVIRSLAATLVAAPVATTTAISWRVGKALTSTLSTTGALAFFLGKTVAVTAHTLGKLTRDLSVNYLGTVVVSAFKVTTNPIDLFTTVVTTGTYSNIKVFLRSFSGAMLASALVTRLISRIPEVTLVAVTSASTNRAGKPLSSQVITAGLRANSTLGKVLASVSGLAGGVNARVGKSVVGAIAATPFFANRSARLITTTVSTAGSYIKAASARLAGTQVTVAFLNQSIGKVTSATLASTGALTFLRSLVRVWPATLSVAGLLGKSLAIAYQRAMAVQATLLRRINQVQPGNVNSIESMTIKAGKSISTVLVAVPTLERLINRVWSSVPIAAVASAAVGRVLSRTYLGATNVFGALSNQIQPVLDYTVETAGVWASAIRRLLAAQLIADSALIRSFIRTCVASAVLLSGTYTTTRVRLLTLFYSVATSASGASRLARQLVSSVTNSAASTNQTNKPLPVLVALDPTLQRQLGKLAVALVAMLTGLLRALSRTHPVSTIASPSLRNQANKPVAADINTIGAVTRLSGRVLATILSATAAAPSQVSRVWQLTVSASGVLARQPGKSLTGLVATGGTLIRVLIPKYTTTMGTAVVLRKAIANQVNASIQSVPSWIAQAGKYLAAQSVATAATLYRLPGKALLAVLESAGHLPRALSIRPRATAVITGSLNMGKLFLRAFAGTSHLVGRVVPIRTVFGLLVQFGSARVKWFSSDMRVRWSISGLRTRWRK